MNHDNILPSICYMLSEAIKAEAKGLGWVVSPLLVKSSTHSPREVYVLFSDIPNHVSKKEYYLKNAPRILSRQTRTEHGVLISHWLNSAYILIKAPNRRLRLIQLKQSNIGSFSVSFWRATGLRSPERLQRVKIELPPRFSFVHKALKLPHGAGSSTAITKKRHGFASVFPYKTVKGHNIYQTCRIFIRNKKKYVECIIPSAFNDLKIEARAIVEVIKRSYKWPKGSVENFNLPNRLLVINVDTDRNFLEPASPNTVFLHTDHLFCHELFAIMTQHRPN